jgi:hypothetical protein
MGINFLQAWNSAVRWVRMYSIVTIAAVLYGIAVAHVPAIAGLEVIIGQKILTALHLPTTGVSDGDV